MPANIPLHFVDETQIKQEYVNQSVWLEMSGFVGQPGTHCLIPSADGELARVLVGKPAKFDTWTLAELARSLPAQKYELADEFSAEIATKLCLGWVLGQYRFTRYKQTDADALPELAFPDCADQRYITIAAESTYLVRDLINTPALDMGPEQLAEAAQKLAEEHGASCRVTLGEALLAENYPMIYAVGRASAQSPSQAPRLIDIRWGEADAAQVTLVGKGVCFDTGGLNMKSSAGMKLMKKDMGGAAQVLGLAKMIMQMSLPVRLRVLVSAVENSISGNALRPLDVLTSRQGTTVEIGNTDAEGRLVLADALTEASSESPELLIDCATLTGAARIAVGTEIAALFCNDDATAQALLQAGKQQDDPLWQLPLHQPYRSMLDSNIADLNNIPNTSYGGAITAALFLREFVGRQRPWIHIDFMAYNTRRLPGRPEGGDAMGMRALFAMLQARFAR
ncbi:MAG: leucyl aminopeptidase [Phormidesmis priestleyi Ana]|uniref:Probable cytosol aminopeptidase n=1 Tax=Phormidesmis priestleyi Ana TaxID=1666911 RepID=A0A0P7ZH31_9CYAN|nr:MAG: leucyl aminopeptidase [Phormidesmis priestleyi Ana]